MADYKKLSVYDKHEESPFIDELLEIRIDSRKRLIAGKNPSHVVNGKTGEVQGEQLLAIHEKVDKETFTKIYHKGMMQMFNLSKSAIGVFCYITSIAKPNKGDVIFEMDKCKEYTKYKTDKAIFKGLAELIDSELIARSKYHYRYFINPTMFFNGNRITFIKVYERMEDLPTLKSDENDKEIKEI